MGKINLLLGKELSQKKLILASILSINSNN